MKNCHVWRIVAIACVVVILFGLTGCFSREETVTVDKLSWLYQMEIEKNTLCYEDDWSLPADATLIEKKTEIYRKKYDSDGDFAGYQYRTRYYYTIWRWKYERMVETKADDQNPYFGEANLVENERVGTKTETYYIHFLNDKGEDASYRMEKDDWLKVDRGDEVNLKVSLFGNATLLSLKEAIEQPE